MVIAYTSFTHKKMNTLICGSIAYDTIMVFNDRFKNHLLPDQLHILNVSFLVPEMRREFGGCAGNIAYNLKLLGGKPLIMASVGQDSSSYLKRMDELGLPTRHVREIPNSFTAQAFITTDLDDNQITAFHPGAMNFSHLNHIADAIDVGLGIISPDGLELADYCTVNDYEAKLLTERTGKSLEELAGNVRALIVTLGSEGSHIYADSDRIVIPSVKPTALVDPTGCGDAYRAGLLFGISAGWSWRKTGQLASLLGSLKIAERGGQNHAPTRDDLANSFRAAFGDALW